jgi:hypothetical protein
MHAGGLGTEASASSISIPMASGHCRQQATLQLDSNPPSSRYFGMVAPRGVLHAEDLESVFDSRPELIIVGRGAEGRMRVDTGTQRALAAAGIQLIALPTEEACQMYNASCVERITAAALHLTC